MSGFAVRVEIESYADEVLRNKVPCELPDCPVCHSAAALFRRHQARPRRFTFLGELFIEVALCLVIRWKCSGCKKTFTQQPSFALPGKRYIREMILERSGRYLENERATYRSSVCDNGQELFYAADSANGADINDKSLAPSTLHRWISTLGGFQETLRRAQDVILQKDPAATICRDLGTVQIFPRKYRTAVREAVLKRCRQLLHLEAKFRATFLRSIFPFFATRCAWR
jgi:hypothetical protein